MCCSIACAIQLEKSVIITGGGNSDYCTTGQNSGSEKRVEQYNLDGSMGSLPYLNTGRAYHACGKYVQDGEVVSTYMKSTVFGNVFLVQVYIVTGGWNDGSLSSTEILLAGSSEWVEAGALPSARGRLSGVTIENQFYVLGEC